MPPAVRPVGVVVGHGPSLTARRLRREPVRHLRGGPKCGSVTLAIDRSRSIRAAETAETGDPQALGRFELLGRLGEGAARASTEPTTAQCEGGTVTFTLHGGKLAYLWIGGGEQNTATLRKK
jgi:hypothetical protein